MLVTGEGKGFGQVTFYWYENFCQPFTRLPILFATNPHKCCNHGHNFLRLIDVWLNFSFTASEVKLLHNYTSCLTSCQMTQDLGSEEIRKYQENLKTLQSYNLVPKFPHKINFFHHQQKTVETWKLSFSRSALFHRKTRVCLEYRSE